MLSRELFWGIKNGWLTYIVAILAIFLLAYLIYLKLKNWQLGLPEKANIDWKIDAPRILRFLLTQRLLEEQKGWGVAHLFVFYGFIVLFAGTILLMIDAHIHHFLIGNVFVLYKFILNFFGLLALVGIVLLFLRRYVLKLAIGDSGHKVLLSYIFSFLALITGFLVEGSRIAINPAGNYGWQLWAFPVYPLVMLLYSISQNTLNELHTVFWWVHMFLSFLTITALGWTRLSHLVLVPINIVFQAGQSPGKLRDIKISEEYFGVDCLSDFTTKQLISIDACVSAGRCEVNCPAFNSGKPLSPRAIMEKLQKVKDYKASLVGEIVGDEELWACTTCGACQQKCPVLSNPVEKIIDLRRYQVMAMGNMPPTWQSALMSLQRRGHPWNAISRSRLDWTNSLDVPIAADKKQFDVLFWVGCTGALVERNIKVSQSIVRLLKHNKVDFAILGTEENCCCHMARRVGDEYLYQEMTEKNKAVLKKYNYNTIITACPHCYHTLKNEYRLADEGIQVLSHISYFGETAKFNLLNLKKLENTRRATYHDPCYYGRINNLCEQPRAICRTAGIVLIEADKSRENSFCCGGGGGGIWLEDKIGSRIFENRAKQLLENDIELILTACPFCITMLESAVSYLNPKKTVRVMDIAELLADQLQDF